MNQPLIWFIAFLGTAEQPDFSINGSPFWLYKQETYFCENYNNFDQEYLDECMKFHFPEDAAFKPYIPCENCDD